MVGFLNALRDVFDRRPKLQERPLPELEPLRPTPRPMTGLWALMNDKQRAALMSYDGDECHGAVDARS